VSTACCISETKIVCQQIRYSLRSPKRAARSSIRPRPIPESVHHRINARSRCGRHCVRDPFPSLPTQLLPSSQGGISGTYPSLVFVLLLPLPLPFCNDGQAATVKLVHLLKHSVYFGLGDQPPFIGEIDLSLLVPPFDAPGPEPNKVQPSRAWIRQSPWHSGDRLSSRAAPASRIR